MLVKVLSLVVLGEVNINSLNGFCVIKFISEYRWKWRRFERICLEVVSNMNVRFEGYVGVRGYVFMKVCSSLFGKLFLSWGNLFWVIYIIEKWVVWKETFFLDILLIV